MPGGGPCYEVDLALLLLLDEFHAVAIDLHTEPHPQGVGKVLADEILGAERLAVIVVIGAGAADGSHDELAAGLYACQVELFCDCHGVEHGAIGRDHALLLLRAGEHNSQKYVWYQPLQLHTGMKNAAKLRIFIH